MLSNAYFLAKFRFDTAENEPAKKLRNLANFPNFANPNPIAPGRSPRPSREPSPSGSWSGGASRRPPRGQPDFLEKSEITELCKGVHCVDLGESIQTHIFLQILASIQPRTSPVKFARSSRTPTSKWFRPLPQGISPPRGAPSCKGRLGELAPVRVGEQAPLISSFQT